MAQERTGRPWPATALTVALQLFVNSALAWGVTALLAYLVMVWMGGAYRLRFAQTALVVGGFWLLAGGSLVSRLTTLSYQGWGVHIRSRDLVGDTMRGGRAGTLTGFGVSILVGPQLMVAGLLLLP